MQKIMFNDRYGLTRAVIEGRKTITRRVTGIPAYPRFEVGEIVAVAQSYEQVYRQGNLDADDAIIASLKYDPGMSNKMYVRANLMPHRIRITGVRCERLQDISYQDCIKEGIDENYLSHDVYSYSFSGVHGAYLGGGCYQPRETAAKKAFALLIDKVSGRGTWERNPWVVVYEFELVK